MTRLSEPASGRFRRPALLPTALATVLAAALLAVPGPAAPARAAPAASAIEGAPAEGAPAEEVPAEEVPAEEVPAEGVPVEEAAPVDGQGVRELPVDGVDGQAARSRAARAEAEPLTGAIPQDAAAALPLPERPLQDPPPAGPAAEADPSDDGQLAALTAPRATPGFTAAGLTWSAEAGNRVLEAALRVREDGEWSGWMSLEVLPGSTGEGPGSRTAKAGTDPVLTLGADGVQARVLTATGQAPADLSISLVSAGTAATDGRLEPAPAGTAVAVPAGTGNAGTGTVTALPASYAVSASAASTALDAKLPASVDGAALRPALVTRAQWGANESQSDTTDRRSLRLKAMYVHHTASSNNYTRAQAYQQIRAIYDYHTRSLGWDDIGYQFLVDRFGTIYEGRRGALTQLTVGAQAGGYNAETIGVSMLGNFDIAAPPPAAVGALAKVLAWKGYQYNLDVTGRTTLTTTVAGPSTARAQDGTRVRVPVVLGHRDTNQTACPGRYLYPKLGSIRQDVARRIKAATARYGKAGDALAAPAPAAVTPAAVTAAGTVRLEWKPVDRAVAYQVMYRGALHGESFTDGRIWRAGRTTTGTTAKLPLEAGETIVYGVRALDSSGRTGAITKLGQATRGVSLESQVKASHWRRSTDPGAPGGIAFTANGSNATLGVAGTRGTARVSVTALSGTAPASLSVKVGGTQVGTLSFPPSGDYVTKTLALPSGSAGTLTLVAGGPGVKVAGIALPRAAAAAPPGTRIAPAAKPALSSGPSRFLLSRAAAFSWKPQKDAARYTVWARRAAHGEAMPSSWTRIATTTATSLDVPVRNGETVQVGVRAVSRFGGSSPRASFAALTRTPLMESLKRSSSWRVATGPDFYADKAYRSRTKGAWLRLGGVRDARGVQVVAARGSGYGRIAVYAGTRRVGTIDLSSTRDRARDRVRYTVELPSTFSGTITVRTLDNKTAKVSRIIAAR
ncbi:hypothetical protein NCCP1664_07210 [Zafaria cholistanensis]|uniref:N-acetylmuramoyl-L-alanine amidase n=1 Tax=Zafaria cholistanensis TaxID=1682741 RepID=A0A5A7NMQ7_9MICC|nr:N-acetylmuramoyl-L-alanine amidase [Zafaria cholistanensis]GER22224.1 hypothetical protein NCCP1664_07210 [Zafaria cholistanensis]